MNMKNPVSDKFNLKNSNDYTATGMANK